MSLSISRVIKFRSRRTRNQNRADDQISVRNCFFDRITRRSERLNFRQEDVVQFAQTFEIYINDRNVRSKSDRHFRRFRADDSAADNDNIAAGTPGTPPSKIPRPPFIFSKICRANLNGHSARNFRHRR